MDPEAERGAMVERQIAARGVRDARVLAAMRAVPRELFVGPDSRTRAYEDGPLPIGEGQTISQSYIVALMAEAARIGPEDRVLEVGAGSGYAAAVLARLAARVIAVERHPRLAAAAADRLRALALDNVRVVAGDGSVGVAAEAPFDAILVAAAGPAVPRSLEAQLAPGGRLVIPVGERRQELVRVVRIGPDRFEREPLGPVSFVPLVGEQGWPAG